MSDPPAPPQIRAFLDANVLYSAARGGSLVRLWQLHDVALVTSEYAAQEAWRNLQEETDHAACHDRLADLLSAVEVYAEPEQDPPRQTTWRLRDPSDVPILLAAIRTECHYLVTGDRRCFGEHFGACLDGVTILRPAEFLRLCAQRPAPPA